MLAPNLGRSFARLIELSTTIRRLEIHSGSALIIYTPFTRKLALRWEVPCSLEQSLLVDLSPRDHAPGIRPYPARRDRVTAEALDGSDDRVRPTVLSA